MKDKNSIKDYFVERDGKRFAGIHLLCDLWGVQKNLQSEGEIARILREAADAAGASEVSLKTNRFTMNGGITGILLLAESHLSIHTWPERSFVAIDVFMCGSCDPYRCIPIFKEAFQPSDFTLFEQLRGLPS